MLRRLVVPLLFVPVAASSLYAGPAPVPLCIVQTRANQAIEYDPSAGPWAIGIYNQLSGQKLHNGSPLKITVLAASVEKDVLPEVRRLRCVWVVQLWYNHREDDLAPRQGVSSNGPTPRSASNPQLAHPESEDSLFFSLWNATTQKVVARGSAPLRLPLGDLATEAPNISPCAGFAKQTLQRLNQLR